MGHCEDAHQCSSDPGHNDCARDGFGVRAPKFVSYTTISENYSGRRMFPWPPYSITEMTHAVWNMIGYICDGQTGYSSSAGPYSTGCATDGGTSDGHRSAVMNAAFNQAACSYTISSSYVT